MREVYMCTGTLCNCVLAWLCVGREVECAPVHSTCCIRSKFMKYIRFRTVECLISSPCSLIIFRPNLHIPRRNDMLNRVPACRIAFSDSELQNRFTSTTLNLRNAYALVLRAPTPTRLRTIRTASP